MTDTDQIREALTEARRALAADIPDHPLPNACHAAMNFAAFQIDEALELLDETSKRLAWAVEAEARLSKVAEWKPRKDHPPFFTSGDQYLVSLKSSSDGGKTYYWEYAVIRVECDEEFFEVTCDGESWGWEWDDVDFYMPLSEFRLTEVLPTPPPCMAQAIVEARG